jgi:molecular chaperone GrpE
MANPRPTPDQDVVRDRMRAERDTVPEEEETEAPQDGASAAPSDAEAGGEPVAETADPGAPPEEGDPTTVEGGVAAGSVAAESPSPDGDGAGGDTSDAERKREEYLALAQRTQADFDNYRKRAARDVAGAGSRAKVALARDLLPAIDNLERALEAAGEAGEAEQGLAHGVRFVHDELIAALGRSGIERFDPSGEPFDPNQHEAIATRSEEGVEAGHVVDVAQKGYRSQDTVVRPARVVVSA